MTGDIETATVNEPGAVESPETERIAYRTMRLDVTQLSAHWPQIAAAIQASVPEGFDRKQFVAPNVFQDLVSGRAQVWAVQAMRAEPAIVMWVVTRKQVDALSGKGYLTFDALYAYETVPDDGMQEAFQVITRFAQGGGMTHVTAVTSNPRLIGLAQTFGADTSQRFVYWRAEL